MSSTLHLSLGDAAARALSGAGLAPAEGLLAWKDEISVGPLTALDDDAAWLRLRVAFWKDVVRGRPVTGMTSVDEATDAPPPGEALPRQLSELRAGLRASGGAEVWIGQSLQELMFLALVAHVARQEGLAPGALALRQYRDDDDDPMDRRLEKPGQVGRARHGVASLPAATLEHAPTRAPLAPELDEALAELWAALTAPAPTALAAMARIRAPGPVPGMRAALRARLHRFPDWRTGLVAAQALLLDHCDVAWTPCPRLVGAALRDNAGPDRFGDLALFRLLRRMADPGQPDPPVGMRGADRSIAGASARLTTFGQMILDGDGNHWRTNGIDLWVGGVHVSSSQGTVWVFDGDDVVPA